MDSKLILVHALMLLYWESLLDTKTENSAALVKEVLDDLKLPEVTLDTDSGRDIIVALRATILMLCSRDQSTPIDKEALLQRIRLNVKDDVGLYEVIVTGLKESDDQVLIRKKCIEYARLLLDHLKNKKFKDVLRNWMSNVLYAPADVPFKINDIALAMQAELDPFVFDSNKAGPMGVPGVVGMVEFDDLQSIEDLFKEAKEETSLDGILRTGYQAINRMTGSHNGFRRGDFIVVGALQHNYKTGFTLNLTRQIGIYNKPYMLDPMKKPLILHISSENALTDNLMLMYASMMENMYGEPCNVEGIDEATAAAWINEQMSITGYTFKMLRVNPSEFTYQSLFQLVLDYEAAGWEIHLITFDYLNMISKAGCAQGATGADTRDLFRRVRNFMAPRKITFITPHQISTEAKYLLRAGVDSFVKEIANKGYWDSCKTIDQEVDMEILIHIEKVDGESYLTVQRGKHRKAGPITPEKDLYTVLPFFNVGAVRDDIMGEDLSMRKVGANKGGEDGGWFNPG